MDHRQFFLEQKIHKEFRSLEKAYTRFLETIKEHALLLASPLSEKRKTPFQCQCPECVYHQVNKTQNPNLNDLSSDSLNMKVRTVVTKRGKSIKIQFSDFIQFFFEAKDKNLASRTAALSQCFLGIKISEIQSRDFHKYFKEESYIIRKTLLTIEQYLKKSISSYVKGKGIKIVYLRSVNKPNHC